MSSESAKLRGLLELVRRSGHLGRVGAWVHGWRGSNVGMGVVGSGGP